MLRLSIIIHFFISIIYCWDSSNIFIPKGYFVSDMNIKTGLDVLQNRSINGYMGPYGYMPPKGARLDLTEKEVFNAVDYMLSQISQ